jgi:hypothetical protein
MQGATGTSVSNVLESYGTGIASFISLVRGRGDNVTPTPVQKDDVIGRLRGRAADASGSLGNTSLEIRMLADEIHNTSGHGTRMEIYTIPTGTVTLVKSATFESSGDYNVVQNVEAKNIHSPFLLMGG